MMGDVEKRRIDEEKGDKLDILLQAFSSVERRMSDLEHRFGELNESVNIRLIRVEEILGLMNGGGNYRVDRQVQGLRHEVGVIQSQNLNERLEEVEEVVEKLKGAYGFWRIILSVLTVLFVALGTFLFTN